MALSRLAAGVSTVFVLMTYAPQVVFAQDHQAPAMVSAPVAMAADPRPASAEPLRVMPGMADLFKPLAGDFKRLATKQNAIVAAFGASGAATSHVWDARVAASSWGTRAMEEALQPGKLVGDFLTQTGGAFAVFAIGHAMHQPRVARIGAEIFRAQIVAQGTVQALKLATRRTRPDGTTLSFPSGHTAAAVATATVLHGEFGWKAGVPAYAVAAWVAASRVKADRHYLSDVIAGATVGLLAGRSVTVGKGAARFSLQPAAVPGGIGINLLHIGSGAR